MPHILSGPLFSSFKIWPSLKDLYVVDYKELAWFFFQLHELPCHCVDSPYLFSSSLRGWISGLFCLCYCKLCCREHLVHVRLPVCGGVSSQHIPGSNLAGSKGKCICAFDSVAKIPSTGLGHFVLHQTLPRIYWQISGFLPIHLGERKQSLHGMCVM